MNKGRLKESPKSRHTTRHTMKRITKLILLSLSTILLLSACSSEDDNITDDNGDTTFDYRKNAGRRTIIAYITGDNNLSSTLTSDLKEMQDGSLSMPSDCRLIAFADINGQKPYIANIHDGQIEKVKEYDHDFYSTSPDSMRSVLQWIIDNFPSEEYATVLEGHGSGPLIRTDTVASSLIKLHAYGYDNEGETASSSSLMWMNIPSMAAAFNSLKNTNGNKLKMTYIFFDCCCCQTAEVAYELRNATEYIVSPVSETPGDGADYKVMVSTLCNTKETVASDIVSTYSLNNNLCISAVKTSEMENLCKATREALQSTYSPSNSPLTLNRQHCIYYYRGNETGSISRTPTLHDIKNIIRTNTTASTYYKWLPYLEKAVIAKHLAKKWDTAMNINFPAFEDFLTDDYYGGISMIAPTTVYDYNGSNINTTMFQLSWCREVGWKDFGW